MRIKFWCGLFPKVVPGTDLASCGLGVTSDSIRPSGSQCVHPHWELLATVKGNTMKLAMTLCFPCTSINIRYLRMSRLYLLKRRDRPLWCTYDGSFYFKANLIPSFPLFPLFPLLSPPSLSSSFPCSFLFFLLSC